MKYFVLLVVAIAVFLPSCSAPRTTAEKAGVVDALLNDYADGPGASIVVVKNGATLYKNNFGLASLEERRPVTSSTNFRLASLTKQFTAMAILILVNEEKLSVRDPMTKFFPSFPSYGSTITVKHLLNHTSGILDYESLLPDTQTVQVHDSDILRLLSEVDSVYFPPGEQYRYSNSGYSLLSLIVERLSGQPFAEFLRSRIFSPLNMENSVAFQEGISTVRNRALGYSRTDSGWIFTDQSPTSAVLGDGGVYSSIDDLLRWDRSLSVGYLIPLYLLREGWSQGNLNDGSKTDYGYGWSLDLSGRYPKHSHTESTRGFRNIYVRYPVQHLSILILTNRNEGDLTTLAREIAQLYLD